MHDHPELSVIVPVLDDRDELEGLIEDLAGQEGVALELLICDGGSSDGTQERFGPGAPGHALPFRLLTAPRGRGSQMNAGAAAARSATLLFLHADSRFLRRDALRTGLAAFREARECSPYPRAARFALSFRHSGHGHPLRYFYHEAKARLDRGDCILGDQGFLLNRVDFGRLGGFDETLPYLEDLRLARRIAGEGRWLLLPAGISTSARRFEQEGFFERQAVSMVIVNAETVGWPELLAAMPQLYQVNSRGGRLALPALLKQVRGMVRRRTPDWQQEFWRRTGRHLAANAWQLFFWCDVYRAFRQGLPPAEVEPRWLRFGETRLSRFFNSPAAAVAARLLAQFWLWALTVTGTRQTG